MIVAMPDIMIARLGSSPITTGNTKVAPNIATTCCAPMPTVRPQESRSSGATTSPGGGVLPSPCNVQPNAISASGMTVLLVAGTVEPHSPANIVDNCQS